MTTIGDAILLPYPVVLDVTQHASIIIRLQAHAESYVFYIVSKAMTRCMRDYRAKRRRSARQFAHRAGHLDRVRASTRPGRCSRSTGSARSTACPAASPARRSACWSRWEWSNRAAGSGITIQPADKWNVFDPRLIRWRLEAGDRAAQLVSLSELRRGFEPAAAALAARRADPHQCRIMAAAVSDMVVHGRSGDLEAYLLADKIFHQTLLEASGNEMFRALERCRRRGAHRPHPPRHDARRAEPRRHRTARPGRARDPAAGRGKPPSAPCGRSSMRRYRLWPKSFRSLPRAGAYSCS